MPTIFSNHLEQFNAYAVENNLPTVKPLDEVEDSVFSDFILSMVDLSTPEGRELVVNPTHEQLMKIGVGADVVVFVDRTDRTPRRIKVENISRSPYCFHTETGAGKEGEKMFACEPLLHYRSDGEATFVDVITGLASINAGWVIAILDFGVIPQAPRNYMFDYAEKNFIRDRAIDSIRRREGNRDIWGNRRRTTFGKFMWNEEGKLSLTKGTYLGSLFNLAWAIIERSPTLDVHYNICPELFKSAYLQAGKPGWIGKYVRPYWIDQEGAIKDLPMGRVNVKAFRKWVLRNYKRFVPGAKQCRREGMEFSRQAEKSEWESYESDMRFDEKPSQ